MPEGHTVHRLARAFTTLYAGQVLRVTSPQGRFADGAAVLDGRRLVASEAWGKQLFLGFAPAAGPGTVAADDVLWLRTHLGLYGAWTFAGAPDAPEVAHAIGAPRRRIGERESVPAPTPTSAVGVSERPAADASEEPAVGLAAGPAAGVSERSVVGASEELAVGLAERPASGVSPRVSEGPATPPASDPWEVPEPRGQVRVRLLGEHAVADLTGPAACEVITAAEKTAVEARLGPDPIRDDGDVEAFVAAVGRSRVTIGQQLMDQAVVAGVGNIYRAEALFRAGVDPLRAGRDVPAATVRAIWDDLVVLMRDGAGRGAIVTTRPEHRGAARVGSPGEAGPRPGDDGSRPAVTGPPSPSGRTGPPPPSGSRARTRQNTDGDPGAVPSDQAFYVYHRDGLPCRVCGSPVLVKELAGRNLFWCGTCQT